MANKQLILRIKTTLLTAYPSRQLDEEASKMLDALWLDVLDDVPDDALQAAAREYTRSAATFAPAPGQLRVRAIELTNGDVAQLAEKAWQGVIDCSYGREPQYLVDPALTNEIMRRLGGYDRMGETPSEWINKNFREPFLKMYAELKQRELSGAPMLTSGDLVDRLLADAARNMQINKPAATFEQRRERLMKQAEAMNGNGR